MNSELKTKNAPKGSTSGPLQRMQDLLAAHGVKPRKFLGQNFLIDPNFALAVAHAAAPDERTLLVEVGPGTGILTRALLDSHPRARVLAIEIDRRLCGLLREELASEIAAGRVTLLEGDVLASKHRINAELLAAGLRISRQEERPRRVLCANLPYHVATPVIANLALELVPFVERIVATVQLELAQRFFGAPGTSEFGPLAVLLALRARGSIVRRVGPQVFWPRPRVSSAVVELDLIPWEACALKPERAAAFQALVQKLFQQRRKTLRAVLKGRLRADDPRAILRAEDLPPEELLKLLADLE